MKWSGWGESNSRPPAPKAGALPLGYTPNADSILSCVGARERPNIQSITENDDSRDFQSRYDQDFRADSTLITPNSVRIPKSVMKVPSERSARNLKHNTVNMS